MEVLPCSGVQYVGETDCGQQSSGTAFVYDSELNNVEHENPGNATDCLRENVLFNVEVPLAKRQSEGEGVCGELPIPDRQLSGLSYSDCQVEGQRSLSNSHDIEDDDFDSHNYSIEPCLASESSHLMVDTMENELPNNDLEGDSSLSAPKWLQRDESVALWVKWRGKWQAGIRCARADWPLSTLRAKPTHDRKQYFVIFFPHTRNYSWADMLLVRPINEYPQPIAYRNHKVGLKMVKDLSVARRYIMQKLAVGMLNIVDQFHSEALIETARDVIFWREFAMEASHCGGYSDLGRMLLKLQSMILKKYIDADWLQRSCHSWAQQCQNAQSAESIELLKEELFESIIWNEVNSLRNSLMHPTLGSGWRTWKHEVMKWFSTSHPIAAGGDVDQQNCDVPSTLNLGVSRKRPKLEVRRAEAHAFHVESNGSHQPMNIEMDTEFFSKQETVHADSVASDLHKAESASTDPRNQIPFGRWDGIVVDAGNSEIVGPKDVEMTPVVEELKESMMSLSQTQDVELTPVSEVVAQRSLDLGSKSRQCIAFIQSKGRQCVRWANDGDVYCCVHLASRFTGSSTKAQGTASAETPMCGGTTVLGTKCKHHALIGSSFCKKHRPRDDINKASNIPQSSLKRKHEEIIPGSESTYCRDIILVGEVESPLQVDPVSVVKSDHFHRGSSLTENIEHSSNDFGGLETHHCIGSRSHSGSEACNESATRHSLYCDQHLPSWLKRARNGRSRIISKEVFVDLLKDCCSFEQKLQLHQASELFYKLLKSILSLRNPVPMDIQLQWALSEASKDFMVGQFLMKLVSSEKDRLKRIWGFGADEHAKVSSSTIEESAPLPFAIEGNYDDEKTIKCKICSVEFLDDQKLGTHWIDSHKKEVQWFFRGYACAICLDSFTNKKVLETHVQERHHVQFVENCMLLQCIPCGSHFGNTEQLWSHVLSVHPIDLRLSKVSQPQNIPLGEDSPKVDVAHPAPKENHTEGLGGSRRFICRFCGLKFDLLPDLGRHHQAAHMGASLVSSRPQKKGVQYYAHRLKSGRVGRPRLKKGLGAVPYRVRNMSTASMKKRIQTSKSHDIGEISTQPPVTQAISLGKLPESECSEVATILFSEIQKTKPRPNNLDVLSAARAACCKVSLKATLEEKCGALPESLYLKAAKLCSEHNIRVEWHQEGFMCPRGCKSVEELHLLSPLVPFPDGFREQQSTYPTDLLNNELEVDECHYILDSHHFRPGPMKKFTVLCEDISFGQEPFPVACVVDEGLSDSLCLFPSDSDGQNTRCFMPWDSFTYVTKSSLDHSLDELAESLQLGCGCPYSTCSPERCDHVYLFDNDYEDAKDIYGKSMQRRFPYDDKGRIILEEGYLVYECNKMCSCDNTCQNRVLQRGVRVKLEVFKTEDKGWAVRAGQPILHGTFVCELIGEVLDEQEANKRRNSYSREGCSYMYPINSHINDMSRLVEGQVPYVIDATKYGNVSRFINHSCSPNLVNYQVLVDSMDCQRSHIGLYTSRDIAVGEELTYNYQYELLPGGGYPCRCGASKCRGCLY